MMMVTLEVVQSGRDMDIFWFLKIFMLMYFIASLKLFQDLCNNIKKS